MEEERRKKRIMWIAILIVMAFIIFFWLNNFRVIMSESQDRNNQGTSIDLKTITADFQDSISVISDSLEQAESISEASSSPDVEELQKRVDELEQAAQNKTASSTCPEYINCMPGPDFDGNCQVPSGCGDITIIAY